MLAVRLWPWLAAATYEVSDPGDAVFYAMLAGKWLMHVATSNELVLLS